ncbi:MAG: thioredoxin domain-containing protein, partial [Alphaproteobacteria bacterium]
MANETSPYLLQHKDNPVDWQPWGPEALARAKAENKPILLSVGYAACHWCHVMAHESFEDEATAALMNQLFVNIKVDREERPDLDSIYQTALAITGQQGGWPLTMFLTPEGKPFAGGTYFPPDRRYGRPAFRDVLNQIAEIFAKEPERVARAEGQIMERLGPALNPSAPPGELSIEFLDEVASQVVRHIDPYSGGFGEAPKFPNTPMLELLWRAYLRTGAEEYRRAVELTLTHMCQGGIYDHLGGGFARYSVDAEWLTPHFEKMLYDNAQLVSLLTLVWQSTKSLLFKQRVEETVDWVLREMRAPEGGFYSSLDADSEGHEGKFYVWSRGEIQEVLGLEDARLFCSVYGVTEEGNFEGANILNRLGSLELLDEAHEMRLAAYREKLLAHRAHRVRPGLDDKILADWNGLMIAALAKAGAAFGRQNWLDAAGEAYREVSFAHLLDPSGTRGTLRTGGRLFHASRSGKPNHEGMAEDYANMIAAAIAVFEATADDMPISTFWAWLKELETHFTAPEGGFFQSRDSAADVITRSRPIQDNATPPANATMLANYARLRAMFGAE